MNICSRIVIGQSREIVAAFLCPKGDFMKRELFENMPDVMDAKQIAEALHLSKAGAYNLLSNPNFPTLRIGGRKLVLKQDLIAWLKSQTKTVAKEDGK